MKEVERWSRHEGMAEEFKRIKELLNRRHETRGIK
jgi:hypothetical protein